MGNQMKNKKSQSNDEFNIKIVGEKSNLIKLIESYNYLNMKLKSKNLLILEKNNKKIKLNIKNINKKDKNFKADCVIMEYDINQEKSFEKIKLLWKEKLEGNKETDLIYLIGIKKDPNEEITKHDAENFSIKNNIRFFIISDKNENDVKTFINDLLNKLEKEKIDSKTNSNKTTNINNKQDQIEVKVTFVGSSGAGAKTSLIRVLTGQKFNEMEQSTCSCVYTLKRIELKNKEIDLILWDTIGQITFRSLSAIFLKNSDFVVIGFEVTYYPSFQEVRDWYDIVKKNCNAKIIYLIGNKIDLFESRKINEEEARNLAKELNLRYFEISCATGKGIDEFMDDLKNELIKYYE